MANNIQNATTLSTRGHYFGELNKWLNNVDEKYNPTKRRITMIMTTCDIKQNYKILGLVHITTDVVNPSFLKTVAHDQCPRTNVIIW